MTRYPELLYWLRQVDHIKPLDTEITNTLMRLTITVMVKAVCIFQDNSGDDIVPGHVSTEVYLVRNPDSDIAHQHEWQCPENALRPDDDPLDVLELLYKNEFGGELKAHRLVSVLNNKNGRRGHYLSLLYLCKMEKVQGRGQWFSVDNLPIAIAPHDRDTTIPMMAME